MTNSFLNKLKKSMNNKEHILDVPKNIKKPTELKYQQKPIENNHSSPTRAEQSEAKREDEDLSSSPARAEQSEAKREDEDLSSSAKTKLLIKSRPLNNNKKSKDEKWFKEEGQLVIDIYQTETKLIIQTAIAGIDPEDLDVTIEKDLIIIKGTREEPLGLKEKIDYFVQECYWGPFSRKIILPVEINPDQVQASMRQGVLVIQLPKTLREKKRKIEIK